MCKIFVDVIGNWDFRPLNNFKIGMGSAFNLGGNYFVDMKKYMNPGRDAEAIYSDWAQIGNDIRISTERFVEENNNILSK
jgi:hypothetical protein